MKNEGKESLLERFDAAYKSVTQDRREVYGPPCDTYRRIAALRAIVDECADVQIREVLGMILTRVVRPFKRQRIWILGSTSQVTADAELCCWMIGSRTKRLARVDRSLNPHPPSAAPQ